MEIIRGTTIVGVRRNGKTVIGGDSQAQLGEHFIIKDSVIKVRRIYDDKVIVGFAGNVSDAFAFFREIENALQKFSGNLQRAVVEVGSSWQNPKSAIRRLEAQLIVANATQMYLLTGDGNVIEPDDGIMSIGSGSYFAISAAKALIENTDLSAKDIVKKSLYLLEILLEDIKDEKLGDTLKLVKEAYNEDY